MHRFLVEQESGRNEDLRTGDSFKQNKIVKDHICNALFNDFIWDYWITFTFGYKPSLEEVEDFLYKAHYRVDRRLIKHIPHKDNLTPDERSDWILIPELGSIGLHYHGFIRLNVKPHFKRETYENELSWMISAFQQTVESLKGEITTLGNYERIQFRIYPRSECSRENLKMVMYSTKEFGKEELYKIQYEHFDRVAHTIISKLHWKHQPLYQRKSPNKVSQIPIRHNKKGFF